MVSGDWKISGSGAMAGMVMNSLGFASRPDLKLELLVSQDGGVPSVSKSLDGNESDSIIFKDRRRALVNNFKSGIPTHYLFTDSKLYSNSNATNLSSIPFITRIPRVLEEECSAVKEVTLKNKWVTLDAK